MVQVIWTDGALQMLRDASDWIAKDSARNAAKFVDSVFSKVNGLSKYPRYGYLLRQGANYEVRVMLYGHYQIPYRIDDVSVRVLGFIHAAREIDLDF